MIIRREQLDALGQQAQQQGDNLVTPCPIVPKEAVTEEEAQELFDYFKSQSDIPFDYPVDCCDLRADEMCRIMQASGITGCRYGSSGKPLEQGDQILLRPMRDDKPVEFFDVKELKLRPVAWVYHVAPAVQVRKLDGSVAPMVLDPSLADGPLSPEEWQQLQGDRSETQLVHTEMGDYGYSMPQEYAKTIMEDHRVNRDKAFKEQERLKKAQAGEAE